jgi:hypothetical protein
MNETLYDSELNFLLITLSHQFTLINLFDLSGLLYENKCENVYPFYHGLYHNRKVNILNKLSREKLLIYYFKGYFKKTKLPALYLFPTYKFLWYIHLLQNKLITFKAFKQTFNL